MIAIVDLADGQFSLHSKHLKESADALATLVKSPSLPDFNGPKVEWIGERMIVK